MFSEIKPQPQGKHAALNSFKNIASSASIGGTPIIVRKSTILMTEWKIFKQI